MAARDVLASLQRLLADPPHRVAERFVRTGLRTGLLRVPTVNPLSIARVVRERGLGVRAIHALHATTDPDRIALVDRRRRLTYLDANLEIDALAAALAGSLGARRGEPIALMLENRVEYLIAWFALARLGITCAHLSRYGTADEILPLVERTGARIVLASSATAPVILEVAARRPDLGLSVVHVDGAPAGTLGYAELIEAHHGQVAPRLPRGTGSDSVVYTSGTTGRPKGAVRDLGGIGVSELFRILERLPLHCGDRHLVVAPLYHSGAQAFVLINASLGNAIHVLEKFDAQATLAALDEQAIHNVFLVPTMIHRILDLPDEVHARHRLHDLQAVIAGAAPFPEPLRRRAIGRFGAARVFDFYGATELGWVTLIDGDEMLARPGSVGRAIAGQEIGIFDERGKRLPAGERGKVYTRSKQLMRGYLKESEVDDGGAPPGWKTVDDLGQLDADGYLFLTGRARDMVITGGVNVYPAEVEDALASHPKIAEIAVVGVPDPEWGERLTAVVVAKDGFDPAEAEQWARSRLAPYKVPRRWEIVDALPRNPTGKVLKRELRARLS